MNNGDLLGRTVQTGRVIEPLASCVDDRDGRTLTLEDAYLLASSARRHCDILIVIKNLEAWRDEKPSEDHYGRNFISALIEQKQNQLKRSK